MPVIFSKKLSLLLLLCASGAAIGIILVLHYFLSGPALGRRYDILLGFRPSTLVSREILLIETGEIIEPDGGVVAIGSGGGFALAAARTMLKYTDLSAQEIAEAALHVAADICVYTNHTITVEVL